MTTFGRRVRTATAIAVAVAAVAACSSGADPDERVVTAPEEPAQTLFVVGSGTSVGNELPDTLRQAWPRLLFVEAFPRSTVFVNGAAGPSTVAAAIDRQLPLAQELQPDTVAVWLGSTDLRDDTPATEFGGRMRELLAALAATGPEHVYIANLPRLPAYDEAMRVAYNTEIAAAATASGATLVDIADRSFQPANPDAEYQPDVDGHRVIADAFVAAIAGSRP